MEHTRGRSNQPCNIPFHSTHPTSSPSLRFLCFSRPPLPSLRCLSSPPPVLTSLAAAFFLAKNEVHTHRTLGPATATRPESSGRRHWSPLPPPNPSSPCRLSSISLSLPFQLHPSLRC